MEDNTRYLHNLVTDRCAFFANRVDAYAEAMQLDKKQIVEYLQHLAETYGEGCITGIIDKHVPANLHSSKMPQ